MQLWQYCFYEQLQLCSTCFGRPLLWNSTVRTDLEHLYRIYSNSTHDKHQCLLLQFIVLLMMDAKGIRNM